METKQQPPRPWLVSNGQWAQIDDPIVWPAKGGSSETVLPEWGYRRSTHPVPEAGAPAPLVVWAHADKDMRARYPYLCEITPAPGCTERVYCAGLPDLLDVARRVQPLLHQQEAQTLLLVRTEECVQWINRAAIAFVRSDEEGSVVEVHFIDARPPFVLHDETAQAVLAQLVPGWA